MGQTDWLPSSKTAMVEMANYWGAKFAVHGDAWDVPNTVSVSLASKASELHFSGGSRPPLRIFLF